MRKPGKLKTQFGIQAAVPLEESELGRGSKESKLSGDLIALGVLSELHGSGIHEDPREMTKSNFTIDGQTLDRGGTRGVDEALDTASIGNVLKKA